MGFLNWPAFAALPHNRGLTTEQVRQRYMWYLTEQTMIFEGQATAGVAASTGGGGEAVESGPEPGPEPPPECGNNVSLNIIANSVAQNDLGPFLPKDCEWDLTYEDGGNTVNLLLKLVNTTWTVLNKDNNQIVATSDTFYDNYDLQAEADVLLLTKVQIIEDF